MKLAELRTAQEIRQDHFAKKMNVTNVSISLYETRFNKGKPGTVKKLKRYLNGLGLKLKVVAVVPDGHYYLPAGEIEIDITNKLIPTKVNMFTYIDLFLMFLGFLAASAVICLLIFYINKVYNVN